MTQHAHGIGAGIAGWSIRHPIGVVMLTLAAMVLGLFALGALKIDLLPHIIYPEVRVRINDPGVPATIMEDEVTRQLEEQLAITEDAVYIESSTVDGRSSVNMSFEYGKDIDIALRDASTRLDRAKRFLPDTIDPPVIYKRDPSQLPVAEYVVGSALMDPVALRTWVDYSLGTWLLNLPGVAAAEVGGGLEREIELVVDQDRLAAAGLDVLDIAEVLEQENMDIAGGRLRMERAEIASRTVGRFQSIDEIAQLPLMVEDSHGVSRPISLQEVARIHDGHAEETLRIRIDGEPGIKLSIQKQPQANTVTVVDAVNRQLDELRNKKLVPPEITITPVNDEARYIRSALDNASMAAVSGALLAMLVVYLFLGSLRRTLIIGSAIPIAVLVTISLMALGGLTLNTMSLGGLALGIGMLVDSTIVMLENIHRHQRRGDATPQQASLSAATEVNSAIVASTSTNLAAVLPFLFIGGLIGLLFRELIITISAAILASMMVALTLVPALAGQMRPSGEGALRRGVNRVMELLQNGYAALLQRLLPFGWLLILLFLGLLLSTAPRLLTNVQSFLPTMDDGRVNITLTADEGINVAAMNDTTLRVEQIINSSDAVESVFTLVGGRVFGRTQTERPNTATIDVQLRSKAQRGRSSQEWIQWINRQIDAEQLTGVKVRVRQRGIRGLMVSRGGDDLSFRVKGPDLEMLDKISREVATKLESINGLRNLKRSNELVTQELSIRIDRDRAGDYGLTTEDVGRAVRFAIEGREVTEFLDGDRSIGIVLKVRQRDATSLGDVEQVVLFSKTGQRIPVRLGDIARVELISAPSNIMRERQQRIVEVSASLENDRNLPELLQQADRRLAELELPSGYTIYEAGSMETLQAGRDLGRQLLGLALFLVLVVMAVQYESLTNPLIILFSVAFAAIGVSLGLQWTETPISMPVWLGMIMLTGIVVNNAIVLVEYIELQRQYGLEKLEAIIEAARLRLRPILMTTLTTVVGMLPLALSLSEGSEMLQPLAVTIVSGLLFSTLVSLLLVPAVYRYVGHR